MTTTISPRRALLSCVDAISSRNARAVVEISDAMALFEIPMLKPNRLHGHDEIRRGLEAAFDEIQTAAFRLNEPAEADSVAITAGSLSITRGSAPAEEHQVGVVAQTCDDRLVRFSLYLNARNRRLWSDSAIL